MQVLSTFAAVVAASSLVLASAGSARAAAPVQWGAASGVCAGSTTIKSATQQIRRDAGLIRIRGNGGPFGLSYMYGVGVVPTFGASDVTWATTNEVSVGSAAEVSMYCNGGSTAWDAGFYDVPTVPTAFDGRHSNANSAADLEVKIPRAGQYVADVTVDQGAVSVDGTTLASSGRVDLGTLRAGRESFGVRHLEGPPTSWNIRFAALPVVLSGVKADAAYARTGDIITVAYTVSGDTRVTATVTDALGAPVRTLATGLDAAMGERRLTWDARGAAGQPLPDGIYTVTVTSTDADGNASSGAAALTVDNGAPVAALATPAEILPTQTVVINVADASSGVDRVSTQTDPTGPPEIDPYGKSYRDQPGPVQMRVEAPYGGGWKVGRHVVRVYSSDKVGNTTSHDLAFTASASAGQKPTTKPTSPSSGQLSPTWKSCGNLATRKVFKLRTLNGPSCATAKRVARAAAKRRSGVVVSGYRCTRTSSAYTCRNAGRTIRWNRRR